jgi:hypothetical protein
MQRRVEHPLTIAPRIGTHRTFGERRGGHRG